MADLTAQQERELLEAAAKAAGISGAFDEKWGGFLARTTVFEPDDGVEYWNPITDDGDALRLAGALGLVVDCSRSSAGEPFKPHAVWLDETMSNAELTRLAIVRAAAAIGRAGDGLS